MGKKSRIKRERENTLTEDQARFMQVIGLSAQLMSVHSTLGRFEPWIRKQLSNPDTDVLTIPGLRLALLLHEESLRMLATHQRLIDDLMRQMSEAEQRANEEREP